MLPCCCGSCCWLYTGICWYGLPGCCCCCCVYSCCVGMYACSHAMLRAHLPLLSVACAHGYMHTAVHKPACLAQRQLQQQAGALERNAATPAAGPAVKALHRG